MFLYFISFLIIVYALFDVNYLLRTYFTVISGYLFERNYSLIDVTVIYGMCTFQDCDIWFRHIREARLLREIDIARYHFYQRTGIYRRSRLLSIRSLQGCTLTVCHEPIGLFGLYKINTKLVYWDDCSLFFEHEIITLSDNRTRYFIISRQHALGAHGESIEALLVGLPGLGPRPECPENIKEWLLSMQITSSKIRSST
ncbi:protein THEM6-like [Ostrinia furnacalis]|uniref:protein THEM6-like n=1 Tax=Ostrinia furnacalis TaxID=93504 RepID=UPI00103D45F4|nr:protein THEM6-like [Ostrinia furnacalis]